MQALQIFALGIRHQKRVILAAAKATHGPRIDASVYHGTGDDLLEEVHVDRARARKREELAARRKQPQAVEIDVFIRSRGTVDMIVTRSELGRIENHKIEVLARITIAAKCLENVVTNPLGALFSKAVAASIACSHVERLLRRVDRNNLVGAALEKSKREAARVAEAIERSHAAAVLATECLCNLLCGQAAFTLVDIKARLVPDTHIDAVKNAVLADFDFLGRLLASQQPRAKLKTLAAARSGVGTIEDAFGARSLDQSINDDFAMRLNARRLELRDEIVAVLVDDQTGQLIGFTENKANSIRAFAKRRAGRLCFRAAGAGCVAISAKQKGSAGQVRSAIEAELRELLEKRAGKGMAGARIRVMVVGIPNVGKSSLINKMCRGGNAGKADVQDRPGVTRQNRWFTIGKGFELLDTPGVLWPKFDDPIVGERLAFTGAVKDDVVDVEGLASRLLEVLRDTYPQAMTARYKLEGIELSEMQGYELLELVGKKRGFLVSGGEINTERAAITVLDEFRSGKLGKITLELP